jgi:hypothetical protein
MSPGIHTQVEHARAYLPARMKNRSWTTQEGRTIATMTAAPSDSGEMGRCLGKRKCSQLATKRRGLTQQLDFADCLAKYIGMVIIALDQKYCRAGHLQIGK